MELRCAHCGLEVKALDEIRERVLSSFDRWQCPDCNLVSEIEKERTAIAGESNPYRRTVRHRVSDDILVVKQLRKLERPFKKRERARKRQLAKKAAKVEKTEYGRSDQYAFSGKDLAILMAFGVIVTLLTVFGR